MPEQVKINRSKTKDDLMADIHNNNGTSAMSTSKKNRFAAEHEHEQEHQREREHDQAQQRE